MQPLAISKLVVLGGYFYKFGFYNFFLSKWSWSAAFITDFHILPWEAQIFDRYP